MLSAHPAPGQPGLGIAPHLGHGPGWKIFPWGSFSVGSEPAGAELSFPAVEPGLSSLLPKAPLFLKRICGGLGALNDTAER